MSMPKKTNKVLVISRANPEMDYLAAGLSQRGLLGTYVRPYARKGRLWEKAITFFTRGLTTSTIGRRGMPEGLDMAHIREAGVIYDFATALLGRVGNRLPFLLSMFSQWSEKMGKSIENRIGALALQFTPGVRAVVGNVLVSLPAFKATDGLRVLNSSNAHYKYLQAWAVEEGRLTPGFLKELIPWANVDSEYKLKVDQEYVLADRILVGSSFAKNSHTQFGIPEDKLIVVPYGVDLTLFQEKAWQSSDQHGLNILYVGQIGPRKGVSYLLQAYEKFHKTNDSLTLVGNFAGSREPFTPFLHLFTHIPHVPRTKLAELYKNADVFLFPSLVEGMGLVVLEAMACGLPVIATPNGPGDIVRDGVDGFLVPPRDVDAIVARLEYLRSHPQKCREMGHNAAERAKIFTWGNYAQAALAAILEGKQIHPGLKRNNELGIH